MKFNIKLISILFIACILIVTSCGDGGGGGDDPQPAVTLADKVLEANTWNLVSVSGNDGDITNLFSGFTVSFSNGSYTANNDSYGIWESSGTYSLSNIAETSLNFSLSNGNTGSLQVSGEQINVQVSVPNTIFGGGRVSSLAGTYQFILKK